jgi:spore coat protein U-like protein
MQAHAGSSSGAVAISATVVSKNQCRFSVRNLTLALGEIDPLATLSVSRSVTTTITCGGNAPNATYFISSDDGLYETGTNAPRMRHLTLTTQLMPYALTISPASATIAKNVAQTITITGTVLPADVRDLSPGGYSDTVTITLTP